MGVSSRMFRSIITSRGNRGSSNPDKGVKLDFSKGAAENLREILLNVCKKHGVLESHQVGYLNAFVKIITDCDKDFGFPVEDILLCLRPVLVHESSHVRAAALRVVKFLICTKQDFSTCIKLQYPCLLVRSLDLLLDNDVERTQALRVVRRLLTLNAAEFPIGLARCLVSLTMTPFDIRDRLIRAVLGTLVELCVLNPDVFIASGGVKALIRVLCNVGSSPRIGEAVVGALLFLVNKPETRIKAAISLDCLAAPFTDPHTIGRPSEINVSTESQLQWAHHVLVSLLRSWPGVLHFCHPDKDGLRSIVNTLYLNQREVRRAVLDLLYDLLCLAQPEWSDEISVALDAVDPSRYQESFKLSDGFVASEGKTVLPHISKSRVNIVEVHLALLLYCFLEVGLLDAVVEVIVSDDTFLSVRATILLGELLHLIHLLLPPECCHLTPALPNLLSYAVRGRPATCINRPTVPVDKPCEESHFERFKIDSVHHDTRQKKKESISSVSRTDRVRTISSQSCRSRTVSDSSGERSRIDRLDNDCVAQGPFGEIVAPDYRTTAMSRTTNILRDVRDALSDITERQSVGAAGEDSGPPFVPDYDTYIDPEFFNVPEQLPLSSHLPPDLDIPIELNPVNIDLPYSSRAQQRALTAVSALSQLHRLLRKRPAPSSIFLDHLITCIDRKESPNCYDISRTKGRSSMNKNKLSQQLTKECEEAIKESGVLSVKDPFIWNWDSIRAVLKGKAPCLYESSQRQFLRKLIQFLLPKSRQLLRVDVGIDRRAANAFTLTAFELIDCLLSSPEESECEKLLLELLTNISTEIDSLLSSKSAHDCLFSPQNVLNTSCSDYFFYIGHLSRTPAGYKVLEKVNLLQQLFNLVSTTNHECFVKIIVSTLDYTSDTFTRKIFSKALSSQNLSCRLYCTKLLHVMLRAPLHSHPDMVDWVVELLVNQLYDEEKVVVNAAIRAFDEACDCKEYLEAIVKLRPSLLHLGDSGLLLLIRFLSTSDGFSYLQEANFVSTQLERWASHYNYKYVCLVESQLCDSLSLHQRGDDGRYCARLSGIKHSPAELFLPPHLYGQLTQHEAGFNVLKSDESIRKLIKIVILGHCRTDDEILQLKAALWGLGHISGSMEGAKWARNNRVTMAMVHTARFCPVYSVRATAFYALNITATNPEGATTLRTAGWHTVRHHRHEKWPVLATSDLLEDISSFIDCSDDNEKERDFNRLSVYSSDGIDNIGKNGIFYLPKDPSTAESDDDFILRLPGSSGMSTAGGKSATLPHYIGSSGGSGLASKYFHSRSASESKADAPSVTDDSSTQSPYFDITNASDISDIRIMTDIDRKSRSNSFTTGSSSSNSNVSGFGLNNDSVSTSKHINSVISDKLQTLSPIPSAGSLTTVKSTGQTQAVRKSSYTANLTRKQSGSRLSHQDAIGYATLKLLHKSRRPLPTPVPALSPLSPIELIAFQDLKQMSPLVRPRHSSNKPLISEFEAQGVKLSHLLGEVGAPPTLPYQSSRSCITCTSDASTPDDENGWNGPCYMGICLPQRLADLFPDDEEPRIVMTTRTGAKESYRINDTNLDLGIENISSAESETDTGTDTGGYGGMISVQVEVPIKRRHNRNNCLLCSTSRSNNQRVSRWRKISASSTHRTRTETESSYGGAAGEVGSPVMLPWQTKGGLEGINSVDSSSTDVTSVAHRSINDNLKSRSMVRRDLLKFVEQLSNPVLYKTCKQALLHMKQVYSDVFQDICVYSDVYHIISSTSHRIQSRRFLQELFLDVPFTEMYEESAALLAGGESGDEFDEESTLAATDDMPNDGSAVSMVDFNETLNNNSFTSDNTARVNLDSDLKNDMDIGPVVVNGNMRLKSNNGKTSASVSNVAAVSNMGGNQSMLLQLEVIPETDARSDSSDPFCRIDSRDNSIVNETFITGEISGNRNSFDSMMSSSVKQNESTKVVNPYKADELSGVKICSDKILDVEIKKEILQESAIIDETKGIASIVKTENDIKKSSSALNYSVCDKKRSSLGEQQETEKAKEIIKITSNKITELQESLKFDRKRSASISSGVSVAVSSTTCTSATIASNSSSTVDCSTASNTTSTLTFNSNTTLATISLPTAKDISFSRGVIKSEKNDKNLKPNTDTLVDIANTIDKNENKISSVPITLSSSSHSNETKTEVSCTDDISPRSKDNVKKRDDLKSIQTKPNKKSSLPQKLKNLSEQNCSGMMLSSNANDEKLSKKNLNDEQSVSGKSIASRNPSSSTGVSNKRQRKKATTKIPNRESLEVDQKKDSGSRKK